MPRPITITEDMKQVALSDFAELLDDMKLSNGEIKYSRRFNYQDGNAVVWLTLEAYKKIVALVMGFSDEVGWHGSVSRSGENEFTIDDIFVYPQTVTGSTVNTDQTAYSEWLYSLDDNTFNALRMQGHSHVNMGVSPSGVDDKHRQQILSQLEKDMFYIFMIWNKSLSIHALVYDMKRNVLYENADVEVKLRGGEEMDIFLADAKEKVQKHVHNPKPASTDKKSKRGSKKQTTAQLAHIGDISEFDDFFGYEQYPYEFGGGRAWQH
ncbi:MAG: hypothetical protein FWC16_01925 [Defluviitaleaceae bacterium]|nr:hypothetical protein [Defluviitaleaceae bacterium]MCL2273657.1 hypothetical protein [Defluviitaleaceae bacterium]